MITFPEFVSKTNSILERYYPPDEPLPGSGKTPLQKAEDHQNRPLSSNKLRERGRRKRHKVEIERSVKRGADNPSMNIHPHPELHIKGYRRGGDDYEIYHKPTGIKYHVSKNPEGDKHVYSIAWNHSHRGRSMSDKTARHTMRNAIKVWKNHIEHRLPYGSIVHNSPTPSFKERGADYLETNPRAKIYQRLGFGPVKNDNQYAKVGRNPSPKQKAKRKNRLTPLEGI